MVLLLAIAVMLSVFSGSLLVELLGHFGVAGFKTQDDAGSVLVATLCFHGAAIVAVIIFLKLHDIGWREALGLQNDNWKLQLLLAVTVLAAAFPVMFGLKIVSVIALHNIGWSVDDQRAVEMFSSVKSGWLRVYLGFFAVVIAPVAEEFIFRGILYSTAKKLGWPTFGWVGVSLLFAIVHFNAPIFLPLLVLALALTWLYEKTEGLFAPIMAHGLFNAVNLLLLFHMQHAGQAHP
ncbi:MAG: CPBP family intramembrane metalloprotease [Verrucomicrobia bacterium]|nr:CPBP family intramembrane metalloprotease [Verrucomicrobiota bacterium]